MDARRRKSVENGRVTTPPGTQLGDQIRTFCQFCVSFLLLFFDCRFGRLPGQIWSGIGKVFKQFFEHFVNFVDVKRKLWNVIWICYLQYFRHVGLLGNTRKHWPTKFSGSSSEGRWEWTWAPFRSDFVTILKAFGGQNRKKGDPETLTTNDGTKSLARRSDWGGGRPYN